MKTILSFCFLLSLTNCSSDLNRTNHNSKSGSLPVLIEDSIRFYNCMSHLNSRPIDTIVMRLFKHYQPQLDIFYPNASGNVYYNDVDFDSLWMSHEFKINPKYLASENIGIIVACYQLFRLSNRAIVNKDSLFVMINHQNQVVYDYKRENDSDQWIKNEARGNEEIFEHFFNWMVEVKNHGFQYVMTKNISPLPAGFSVQNVRRYPSSSN